MDNHQYHVRKMTAADMTQVMEVMDSARQFMHQTGNPTQWVDGYPAAEHIEADMARDAAYVVEHTGHDDTPYIAGYFAFLPSPDPTYHTIYDGHWTDDTLPYHVIHRIASRTECHGVFAAIIHYCSLHERNLRIDTHRDNHVMQHCITKHHFHYCGIIHIASGAERLAYQRIR